LCTPWPRACRASGSSSTLGEGGGGVDALAFPVVRDPAGCCLPTLASPGRRFATARALGCDGSGSVPRSRSRTWRTRAAQRDTADRGHHTRPTRSGGRGGPGRRDPEAGSAQRGCRHLFWGGTPETASPRRWARVRRCAGMVPGVDLQDLAPGKKRARRAEDHPLRSRGRPQGKDTPLRALTW